MKQVKIGLVGLGFMGTTHWGVYKGMKNAKVVALADVDAKKRKGDISAVVGNIGGGDNSKPLDLSGVTVYDDAFDMITDPDIDIVDICVPTPEHSDLVCAALAVGKHVFCEKPLCRTGFAHLAFSLGSRAAVDDLTDRLRQDGYRVISGPRMTGDGYYESCIVGIEGNQIEITV